MRAPSRRLVLLAVVAVSAGCAAGMKEVQQTPAERARLADAYPLRVLHYEPLPELQVVRLGGVMQLSESASGYRLAMADPIDEVAASFAAGLRRELGERAVEAHPTHPRAAHSTSGGPAPAALRELLGPVVAFDLESLGWRMAFVSRSFIDESRTTYGLDYLVRGRLLRLSDGQVLWQGICTFVNKDSPRALGELQADDWAGLRARRAEVARGCAEQLLGSFTGRTERSAWDGRNKPRAP